MLYAVEHAKELNVDASRLAIMGDSVGGNMSAVVTLLAKERGGPKIAYQVLFYPLVDYIGDNDSYRKYADGPWLTTKTMKWMFDLQGLDGSEPLPRTRCTPTVEQLRGPARRADRHRRRHPAGRGRGVRGEAGAGRRARDGRCATTARSTTSPCSTRWPTRRRRAAPSRNPSPPQDRPPRVNQHEPRRPREHPTLRGGPRNAQPDAHGDGGAQALPRPEERTMTTNDARALSRRGFLRAAGAAGAAAWLTPRTLWGGAPAPRVRPSGALGPVQEIRRAAAADPVRVRRLRGNVSVLSGSGGNVAVLAGAGGVVLVDSGIVGPKIAAAVATVSRAPITHVVNTHWHFDHTDANAWLHARGAEVLAHANTRRRLSADTRVDDWEFTFPASPAGALPATVITSAQTLELSGSTIAVAPYAPAHTDSDLAVHLVDADVLHVADTWWNGLYPFIDYSTGGSIDGTIRATEQTLARVSASHHHRPRPRRGRRPRGSRAVPRHARGVARPRGGAQGAGPHGRRNGRCAADRRVRRGLGGLDHPARVLHAPGLHGRLTRRLAPPAQHAQHLRPSTEDVDMPRRTRASPTPPTAAAPRGSCGSREARRARTSSCSPTTRATACSTPSATWP
jgi:glyoxylase-like metal-dependent hydrolase (beta-lactamase superfamily II)